ncbi:MAG: PAS domain-containing protein, partial [Aureliella sp.]
MSTSFDGTLHGISSEYARVMAESLPHLVWVSRPDGEMEYLNRRCLEYFKLPMADLLGWDWARVVHPDDLPRTMERWTDALRSGGEHSVELRLR